MAERKKAEMTFRDHLMELLNRIRMILYSVIISTIIVMLLPVSLDFSATNLFYTTITSSVIKNLQETFLPPEAELLPISFLAPLEVYIFISVAIGVTISLPVISVELYKFINPAMYRREKKGALPFVGSFAALFIFGEVLGYFYIVPTTMRTLLLFTRLLGLPAKYDFASFFSIVGFTLLLCGLIFTFPIYIVLLVKAGILETRYLTRNRKYLYGGLLIAIAFLDPEPGLVTESLVFIPLVILTEVSIIIAKRIEKAREASGQY